MSDAEAAMLIARSTPASAADAWQLASCGLSGGREKQSEQPLVANGKASTAAEKVRPAEEALKHPTFT